MNPKIQTLEGYKYLINVYSPSVMGPAIEACYIVETFGKAAKIMHHETSMGHMCHILYSDLPEGVQEFDNREPQVLH